jgi:hypothetical protein
VDYISRWNFWLDLRILYMTVEHILWGKTSWAAPARTHARRQPMALKRSPSARPAAICD